MERLFFGSYVVVSCPGIVPVGEGLYRYAIGECAVLFARTTIDQVLCTVSAVCIELISAEHLQRRREHTMTLYVCVSSVCIYIIHNYPVMNFTLCEHKPSVCVCVCECACGL